MKSLFSFLRDEQGQDLIEYTLLMAFIALASAAIFISAGGSVNAIWQNGSTQLSNAAVTAILSPVPFRAATAREPARRHRRLQNVPGMI
jgi:Flp pilus assembly pilin Flp